VLTQLGAQDVSSAVLVEAWKDRGRECDDIFFMHLDVLGNYHFVEQSSKPQPLLSAEQLLLFNTEQDYLLTITHSGREFLHQFGGR